MPSSGSGLSVGHQGLTTPRPAISQVSIGVLDLVTEGLLTVGQALIPRGKAGSATALVLADGSLQVGDDVYETPSGAGKAALGRTVNGRSFWLVNDNDGTCLRDLRTDYAAKFDVDATAEDDQDATDA
jgi:RAMA domain-containing protein